MTDVPCIKFDEQKFNHEGNYGNLRKDAKGTRSVNRSNESRNVSQGGAVHPGSSRYSHV